MKTIYSLIDSKFEQAVDLTLGGLYLAQPLPVIALRSTTLRFEFLCHAFPTMVGQNL